MSVTLSTVRRLSRMQSNEWPMTIIFCRLWWSLIRLLTPISKMSQQLRILQSILSTKIRRTLTTLPLAIYTKGTIIIIVSSSIPSRWLFQKRLKMSLRAKINSHKLLRLNNVAFYWQKSKLHIQTSRKSLSSPRSSMLTLQIQSVQIQTTLINNKPT